MERPQRDDPAPASDPAAAMLRQHEAFHVLMQECQECSKDIEPHWQFCAHCGIRLATSCPACGQPLPPAGALTCASCGFSIPQTPV